MSTFIDRFSFRTIVVSRRLSSILSDPKFSLSPGSGSQLTLELESESCDVTVTRYQTLCYANGGSEGN